MLVMKILIEKSIILDKVASQVVIVYSLKKSWCSLL